MKARGPSTTERQDQNSHPGPSATEAELLAVMETTCHHLIPPTSSTATSLAGRSVSALGLYNQAPELVCRPPGLPQICPD